MSSPSPQAALVQRALEQHEAGLLRFAARILGDSDLERARDVVQDTLLRLWQADPDEVAPKLAPWLFTVCRRRAIDIRRKEHRMEVVPLTTPAASAAARAPSALPRLEARQSLGQVSEVLQNLPERQQMLVRLKFEQGLNYQQMAEVMDLSVSNVGFLLHSALKTIRQAVGPAQSLGKSGGAA